MRYAIPASVGSRRDSVESWGTEHAHHGVSRTHAMASAIHVHPGPADAAERERNRKLLKLLAKDHKTLGEDQLRHKRDTDEMRLHLHHLDVQQQSLQQVLQQEVHSLRGQIERLHTQLRSELLAANPPATPTHTKAELRDLRRDVNNLGSKHEEHAQDVRRLHHSHVKHEQDHEHVVHMVSTYDVKLKGLEQDTSAVRQEMSRFKEECLRTLQEAKAAGKAAGEAAGKAAGEMEHRRNGMQEHEEVFRVRRLAESAQADLGALRKQICDRGLLAPPRDEPPSDEHPPVGTLSLSQDVFTARLLLKLGFLKASLEKRRHCARSESAKLLELSTDSESDSSLPSVEQHCLEQFENVSGIAPPDVEVDSPAHCQIKFGWLFVCVMTMFLQLSIMGLMTNSYAHAEACFEEGKAPTPWIALEWWILHLSRAFAMLLGGAFMVKDLMDTANYYMVSFLLEPHISCEVLLSSVARIVFIGTTLLANVYLFMSEVEPGFIWVNMAALSFVATLGTDILDVARRGVFGHHISKAVTAVSFELTFTHEYPAWFPYITRLTLSLSLIGISISAVVAFLMEDLICESGGTEELVGKVKGER